MKVTAAPGTQCPMEDNPRSYITDSKPVDVPETAYYLRLVDDGSLIKTPDRGAKEKEEKSSGK
jgi:hypothetical protein